MAKDPKKRGLGMGLGALFESSTPVDINAPSRAAEANGKTYGKETEKENSVIYIDVNNIKPNSNQPRKKFDEEKIEDLANSINEHGIIQPLIVRKVKTSGDNYEIVAGERRYRAARKADLKFVPCLVREFTDQENMLVAIIENMQREDLDPIEEAEGLNQMMKTYGLTQDQVSKSIGKSRPYISNSIRILSLPEKVRNMISDGRLSAGHARAILAINGDAKRIALAEKIANEGLSVRAAEKIASGNKSPKGRPAERQKKDREIIYIEEELKGIIGTKVNVKGNANSGAIELEYYSTDELNRLIDLLRTLQ